MVKKLKIIEWNINQRSGGYSSNHAEIQMIPQFVSDEIREQNADVVVLTEFYKVSNWINFISYTFSGYNVFYTMNPQNQNDVLIAVKNNYQATNVEYLYSAYGNDNPNCLHVDIKVDETELCVFGTRVRISDGKEKDYQWRKKQFEIILSLIDNTKKTVIVGDLNNSRIIGKEIENYDNVKNNYKSKYTRFYNYHLIKEDLKNIDFLMHTPSENCSWNGYIKNDHIIAKRGMDVKCNYDWNFTRNNKIYEGLTIDNSDSWNVWNNKCTSIGCPDHAILTVDILL